MTNHLRRVLLAKSVVDCGNKAPNRPNSSRRSKTPLPRRELGRARESMSERLINRLAYDTKHHPHEVVSMSWGGERRCNSGRKKGIRSNSTDSSEDSSLRDHQGSLKSYREKFRAGSAARKANTSSSLSRDQGRGSNGVKKKRGAEFEEAGNYSGESDDFLGVRKQGKSDVGEVRRTLKTFHGLIPCAMSGSEISFTGTPEFVASHVSSASNVDGFSSDVTKYVKFVHDITKEVMERRYYSDREIERVFEKHFDRNLGRLNEKKMLREINSLRKALNMKYDSEDEGEEDEPANATPRLALSSKRSFAKLKETGKVTDERGVINPETGSELRPLIQNARNRTKPIDPEREIIVSKKEILATLLEMDLNPEKAQEICKSLENRSKQEKNGSAAEEDEEDRPSSKSGAIGKSSGADSTSEKKPTSSESSPKPKKEEIISPDPITGEENAAESSPRESSDKLTEGDGEIESEKDIEEEISENSAAESQSGTKSAVISTGEEINKLETRFDDSIE